tara:strand:+ start:2224 stop:3831 length:1608 start_codon:yes stop_codon:yes gene_type:complete
MIEQIIEKIFFTRKFKLKIKKAYEKLKKEKRITSIYNLKENLNLIRKQKKKEIFDPLFEKNNIDIDLSFNQYIYAKFIKRSLFNANLMIALSNDTKFLYPLPKIYLDKISKIVKVNYFLSITLFFFCISILLVSDLFRILFSCINYFKLKNTNSDLIYLDNQPKIIINLEEKLKNDNFYYFILKKFNFKNKVIFFHKNKEIKNFKVKDINQFIEGIYTSNPIKPFLNLFNLYNFIKSFLFTLKFLIKCFYHNRFEMLLLLNEVFCYYQYLNLDKKYSLCLFNNSSMIYRPLWTYANNENDENKVVLYFYSINQMPLLQEINNEKYYDTFGFSLHSWDYYLTWSKKHEEFLDNNTKQNKKYLRVDYVPFQGEQKVLEKQKKIITIFDVPPKKEFVYKLLLNPYNIYTLEYCTNFVNDTIDIIKNLDSKKFELILKIKRYNRYTNPTYIDFINKISLINNVKVQKDISAESIINISDLVISLPFTSAAAVALNKGKKTVYYDPSGKISSKNLLSEDIKIISDKEKLYDWVNKNIDVN